VESANRRILLVPKRGDSSRDKKFKGLKRWRTTVIAEDYVTAVSRMMQPPIEMGRFGYNPLQGRLALERPNLLGFLANPLRRPGVMERWSPYEVATFEGSISIHGKHFHLVQKDVGTKNTKEVVEFYYIWKLTSHYEQWKRSYERPPPPKVSHRRNCGPRLFWCDGKVASFVGSWQQLSPIIDSCGHRRLRRKMKMRRPLSRPRRSSQSPIESAQPTHCCFFVKLTPGNPLLSSIWKFPQSPFLNIKSRYLVTSEQI